MRRESIPGPSGGHVVVIGGGVSGALTAARLVDAGFQVTILEKAHIGNGASSRSAACIRAQFTVKETILGMAYSTDWYCNIMDHLPHPGDYHKPVITQNGYLFLHERADKAHPWCREAAEMEWASAQEDVQLQQEMGVPTEILSASQVHARWPHILEDQIIGATWCPTDGFLEHDAIYRQGFAYAQARGAQLYQKHEVVASETRGGRITSVITSDGSTFEGDWFINASNAWAPRLSPQLGGMHLKIEPQKRYLYFMTPNPSSRPMSEEAWRQLPMTIFGNCKRRGAYCRPEGDKLMIGWGHPTQPETEFQDEDQDVIRNGFGPSENDFRNLGYAALQEIRDFAPTLGDCGGIKHATCGFYDVTPDHNPYIGLDTQLENLVHVCGFSGHGLMHAPVTAALVGAIITGKIGPQGQVYLPAPFNQHPLDLRRFDPNWDKRISIKERNVL